MKNISKFISNIIEECTLDSRIDDGIINLKNSEHIHIIAEQLYKAGVPAENVDEFVEQFIEEGKYPDRQAYNKEGWLVTFPSREYRDAAIKKKTHFTSDPTHGKGGMNLYYKKRGKQKRQTQQDTTAVGLQQEPTQQPTGTVVKTEPQAIAQQPAKKPTKSNELTPQEKERLARITGRSKEEPIAPTPAKAPSDPAIQSPEEVPSEDTPETPTPRAPSTLPMPATELEPDYEELSKKFVAVKHWTLTPFGEYRDTQGNTMAVVGLSGEIVPIKSNDREEYKIFVEKNAVTK